MDASTSASETVRIVKSLLRIDLLDQGTYRAEGFKEVLTRVFTVMEELQAREFV